VEDLAAALGGAFEGIGIAKIAGDAFDIQFAYFAIGTTKRPNLATAFEQKAGDVPAQEAARAGD
jgi:hypothetical protein